MVLLALNTSFSSSTAFAHHKTRKDVLVVVVVVLFLGCGVAAQRVRPTRSDQSSFVNLVVSSFQEPRQVQQDIFLQVNGSPANLNLDSIVSLFQTSYMRQQSLQCDFRDSLRPLLELTHVEFVNFINGFVSSDIATPIDFTIPLRVEYKCTNCQENNIELFAQESSTFLSSSSTTSSSFTLHDEYAQNDHSRRTLRLQQQQQQQRQQHNLSVDENEEKARYLSRFRPCVPSLKQVMDDFRMALQESCMNSCGLQVVYNSIVISYDSCKNIAFVPFSKTFLLAIHGIHLRNNYVEEEGDHDQQQQQLTNLEQAIVQTYNEINILNPSTCDIFSRLATQATIEIVTDNTQEKRDTKIKDETDGINTAGNNHGSMLNSAQKNDDDNNQNHNKMTYLSVTLSGFCDNCSDENNQEDYNYCLTRDTSGAASCNLRYIPSGSAGSSTTSPRSCFCTSSTNDDPSTRKGLPTSNEFAVKLQQLLTAMSEENYDYFGVIQSVLYMLEGSIPDTCCGYPITRVIEQQQEQFNHNNNNGNVDEESLEFIIQEYITTKESATFATTPLPFDSFPPINCWDTSRITDMSYAFENKSNFNEPLHCWDTSGVTDMSFMFLKASSFNQFIGNWDVGNVVSTNSMFQEATNFNQNLCSWSTNALSLDESEKMFWETSCEYTSNTPQPNFGPWCTTC